MEQKMLNYLQSMMNDFLKEKERYGMEDHIVNEKLDAMLACKDMVEAMIGQPVNLQFDGKVTVGF